MYTRNSSWLKFSWLQNSHTLLKYFPVKRIKPKARLAELVDALDSGSSGCKAVEVRFLYRAPEIYDIENSLENTTMLLDMVVFFCYYASLH